VITFTNSTIQGEILQEEGGPEAVSMDKGTRLGSCFASAGGKRTLDQSTGLGSCFATAENRKMKSHGIFSSSCFPVPS